MTTIHEAVKKHIEKATVETAATPTVSYSMKVDSAKHGKNAAARLKQFSPGGYIIKTDVVNSRTSSYILKATMSVGKGSAKQSTVRTVMQQILVKAVKNAVAVTVPKEEKVKPSAKKPSGKPSAKAETPATKAPRGTGKLKSFLKENNIDLKTLKTMTKFL